jgi:hypothetical protein
MFVNMSSRNKKAQKSERQGNAKSKERKVKRGHVAVNSLPAL